MRYDIYIYMSLGFKMLRTFSFSVDYIKAGT